MFKEALEMRTLALVRPYEVVRSLLPDPAIIAEAHTELLEVWERRTVDSPANIQINDTKAQFTNRPACFWLVNSTRN